MFMIVNMDEGMENGYVLSEKKEEGVKKFKTEEDAMEYAKSIKGYNIVLKVC